MFSGLVEDVTLLPLESNSKTQEDSHRGLVLGRYILGGATQSFGGTGHGPHCGGWRLGEMEKRVRHLSPQPALAQWPQGLWGTFFLAMLSCVLGSLVDWSELRMSGRGE